MALGWANLGNNTKLSTVAWDSNSYKTITAWGGGAYDSLRSRMYIHGGGHGDYAGNEIYCVNFGGTPSVQRLTPNTNPSACNAASCDGGITPNSIHSYHDMCYIPPPVDRLFRWVGSPAGLGTGNAGGWLWNPNNVVAPTYGWTYLPQLDFKQYFINSVHYNSNDGLVYIVDNGPLWTWDPTNTANTFVARYFNTNGWDVALTTGCIDTSRNRLYVYPGYGDPQLWYLNLSLANGVNPRVTQANAGGDNGWLSSGGGIGMDYDPIMDRIVILPKGSSNIYLYNPATNSTVLQNAYTGGPTINQTNGNMNRFRWASDKSCFVFVNDFSENAFTLTLDSSTPDTTAPTDPTSLSATAASQSLINLSWGASTDAVGPITYVIERCTGASCSGFTQLNTTSSTSYADNGLTAGTTYRYRVRSHDGALNYSGYTSIAQATTNAGDTTPPTDPSSLSGNVISASEVDLTWTASTDAVGVAGYGVERALGAGAFSQIAAPPSNAWNDLGLSQNTNYRYKVRAFDAANNYSGYSNIISVTTLSNSVRNIGTGLTYTTWAAAVAAASAGDVIEGVAGIYADDTFTISAANLTLRGLGGYAHLKWGTGDYRTNLGVHHIPNGQGIIKAFGTGLTTFENMEFSGAVVDDGNGAGIRYGGTGDMTVRNCYFHDNQNGILGQGLSGNTLIVEYSKFNANGYFDGTFYSHNIYIGQMGIFIFRYCSSTDPTDGHCLKSRARYNYIEHSFLSTKNSTGSIECEFPYGHYAVVKGCVIEQGTDSGNSTVVSYWAETDPSPTLDPTHYQLHMINNTIYSWRSPLGTAIQMVKAPVAYVAKNNAYANGLTFRSGTATAITESNNRAMSDSEWVNPSTADFHLVLGSAAINGGIDPGSTTTPLPYDFVPRFEYADPASQVTRQVVGALDIGAYEYGTASRPGAIPFSRRT